MAQVRRHAVLRSRAVGGALAGATAPQDASRAPHPPPPLVGASEDPESWTNLSGRSPHPSISARTTQRTTSGAANQVHRRFTEFGTDGGPAAKALQPKFSSFTKNISAQLGVVVPHVEMKHVNAATIGLKCAGGLLFILSSLFGAYLLSLYLAFITPVVYDFYNYDMEKAALVQLFIKFTEGSVVHTGILAFSLFEFLF